MRAYKGNCKRCGVLMVQRRGGGHCLDCTATLQREKNTEAAKRYRLRKGITKPTTEKACVHCGESFQPKRSSAKFCSDRCRLSSHRAAKR